MAGDDKETPTPALRVSQLDASELDSEIFSLVKSQLQRLFKYHKTNALVQFEPEVNAALKILIWKFSVFAHDSTIGQQILNLKYASEHAQKAANPWLSLRQKILYAVILIGCPWVKERSDDILKVTGFSKYKNQVEKILIYTETGLKMAALVNFLIFLKQGVFRSLSERILGIQPMFPNKQGIRQVSFEFMTRELMWHGFSEFLFFLLPLINFQRIKNFVLRTLVPVKNSLTDPNTRNLTSCALCGEYPTNAREIGCQHVFCYFCIQSNYKADPSFSCPLCGMTIEDLNSITPVKLHINTKSHRS